MSKLGIRDIGPGTTARLPSLSKDIPVFLVTTAFPIFMHKQSLSPFLGFCDIKNFVMYSLLEDILPITREGCIVQIETFWLGLRLVLLIIWLVEISARERAARAPAKSFWTAKRICRNSRDGMGYSAGFLASIS